MKNLIFIILGISIFLLACDDTDNPPTPTQCDVSNLQFTSVLNFSPTSGACISNGVNGAVIDTGNRVLYMGHRGGPNQELVRIDLSTNTVSYHNGSPRTFCTVRPITYPGGVYLAGATGISSYQTNGTFESISEYPASITNWFGVTRSLVNGQLYWCGLGDSYGAGDDITGTNKIRSYDQTTNTFNTIGTLPDNITRAAILEHSGNLYVFGGWLNDGGTTVLPQGYKYDLTTNTASAIALPSGGVDAGYLCRSGSCLFGAGLVQTGQPAIKFYKYNTIDGVVTELTHNLSGEIIGMTSSDTKIYVILRSTTAGQLSLFTADLF